MLHNYIMSFVLDVFRNKNIPKSTPDASLKNKEKQEKTIRVYFPTL